MFHLQLKSSSHEGAVLTFSDILYNFILGTAEFLSLYPDFVENQQEQDVFKCNKDTGGLKTFHCWSRGIFFIVSAGGHIEYWQPLYR